MYICSKNSRNKVVHYHDCHYVARMSLGKKVFYSTWWDAMNDGCRECQYCHSIRSVFNREKKALKEFCKENKVRCKLKGDSLEISTKESKWKLFLMSFNRQLHLYHKNTVERPYYMVKHDEILEPIDGYHFQTSKLKTLKKVLQYILSHDEFRREHPVGTKWYMPKKAKSKPEPLKNKKTQAVGRGSFVPTDSSYGTKKNLKKKPQSKSARKKRKNQQRQQRNAAIRRTEYLLGVTKPNDDLSKMMRQAFHA